MERIYLTGADNVLPDENNLVNVSLASGALLEHLEPRRLFPVSSPVDYITLLDTDLNEVCLIRNLHELNEESRAAIEASLGDYYLVPIILRILSKDEKYGILRWTVETDHGIRSFDIRNRNHDIRRLPDGRIRVRDSNDNRYTIKSLEGLDKHSQVLLIADM